MHDADELSNHTQRRRSLFWKAFWLSCMILTSGMVMIVVWSFQSTAPDSLRLLRLRGEVFVSKFRHGSEHAKTITARRSLAIELRRQHSNAAAVEELRRLIEDESRIFGPEESTTLRLHHALILWLEQDGKLMELESEYRSMVAHYERKGGLGDYNTHASLLVLCRFLLKESKPAQAEEISHSMFERAQESLANEPRKLDVYKTLFQTIHKQKMLYHSLWVFGSGSNSPYSPFYSSDLGAVPVRTNNPVSK